MAEAVGGELNVGSVRDVLGIRKTERYSGILELYDQHSRVRTCADDVFTSNMFSQLKRESV